MEVEVEVEVPELPELELPELELLAEAVVAGLRGRFMAQRTPAGFCFENGCTAMHHFGFDTATCNMASG